MRSKEKLNKERIKEMEKMRVVLGEGIDKKEYLFTCGFSIDAKFEDDLDNIKFPVGISGEFVDEFTANGYPLSPSVRVIRKENDWVIEDKNLISRGKFSIVEDRMFFVRKEEGKLNIYIDIGKEEGKLNIYDIRKEEEGSGGGEDNGYISRGGLIESEDWLKAIISSDRRLLFTLGKPKSEEHIDLLGLRGEFKRHNLHLSSEARLIPVSKDLWGIVDREKIYKIKKMGE